jgi:hypothetical protein
MVRNTQIQRLKLISILTDSRLKDAAQSGYLLKSCFFGGCQISILAGDNVIGISKQRCGGQHSQAVGILEAFCHDCAVNDQLTSRDYLRAQMHLIEIYEQNGQSERALSLCHHLTNCSNAQVQIWAMQRLKSITQATTAAAKTPAPFAGFAVLSKLAQRFRFA